MYRSQKTSSASPASKLYEENDERIEALRGKLSTLKHISINIGKEVEEQNKLLDGVHDIMSRSQNMLRSAMKRLSVLAKMDSGSFLFWLILFAAAVLFFIYFFF